MKTVSNNTVLSVLLACLCGVISGSLFLRLYGVVFAYLTQIKAVEWINVVPKNIRGIAYRMHLFIIEILVLAIIILITGSIIGAFLKMDKFKASIVSILIFWATQSFYHYMVWNEFSLLNSPAIYSLVIFVITFLMFWYSFYLGELVRNRIR
jgi:hypothetical protein